MQKSTPSPTPNRTYKSRLFMMIFHEKKALLELYNAVSGKHYTDPELLEINTLEHAIYMAMQNDVSFMIGLRLSLYEHQSTFNPNLPLRYLFYISDLYSGMIDKNKLYGSRKILIPPPEFVIFYNGIQDQPDRRILRLSDLYSIRDQHCKLELEAVMLNINLGHNPALMNACTMLRQYAEYTDRVRRYTKTMSLEDAVEHAITECIHEGILKSFLEKNRAEVKNVCIYEYDEEEHIRLERSYAWEDGKKEGLKEGIRKGEKGKTCNLIQKKLEKGKTLSQIADELEDTEENIGRLIEQFHLGIPQ